MFIYHLALLALSMKWFIGFFFHEMAFGLLSVFLPLYVVKWLGGSLIDVGLMVGLSNFIAVPSAFLWGYLCDKTERYRQLILLSFFALAILLYFFSKTTVIAVLIFLNMLVGIFHVGHEPPKNVLIAEYYSRGEWEWGFTLYEALTELGWASGLLLGFILSNYGYSSVSLLLFSSFLSLIASLTSVILVKNPVLSVERGLVSIERAVGLAYRGSFLLSKAETGRLSKSELAGDSLPIFSIGLALFSLAAGMFFTPLPVFLYKNLSITPTTVFAVFFFNSLANFVGYIYAGRRSERIGDRTILKYASVIRAFLCASFSTIFFSPLAIAPAMSAVGLIFMGFAYGLFAISSMSLSMEIVPRGRAGLYNALIGLGGALGCLIGPLLASYLGFLHLFVSCGFLFFLSYVAFKLGLKDHFTY